MGLFNRTKSINQVQMPSMNHQTINENTIVVDGYIIGESSHFIYDVPTGITVYHLPNVAFGITESALKKMSGSAEEIIVPGSFKQFIGKFDTTKLFRKLNKIILEEGIEKVDWKGLSVRTSVDFKLPSTIKTLGEYNYPITKELILPSHLEEIPPSFASHDLNLTKVVIPGSLKKVPHYAFRQCKNIQDVTIEEGVTNIDEFAFDNLNKLKNIRIPSTFNGSISLLMEARPGTTDRGNASYDCNDFENDKRGTLSILIKRGNKDYELRTIRGNCPKIRAEKNNIIVYLQNGPAVTIDSNILESGVYDIVNDELVKANEQVYKETEPVMEKQEQINHDEELMILFQNAFKENIVARDDFKGINDSKLKIEIKKRIRAYFDETLSKTGETKTDYVTFDWWFNKALKEIEMENSNEDYNIGHSKKI